MRSTLSCARLGPATGFDLDDEVAGDPVEEAGFSRLIIIDLIDMPTQYLGLSLPVIHSRDLYYGPLRESRPAAAPTALAFRGVIFPVGRLSQASPDSRPECRTGTFSSCEVHPARSGRASFVGVSPPLLASYAKMPPARRHVADLASIKSTFSTP